METSEKPSDITTAAKNILETLLDLMGMQVAVVPATEFPFEDKEKEAASSVNLNIEGEDLGILIGRRGQTLASLQYIVRLIVGHQMQIRPLIIIDVEGY